MLKYRGRRKELQGYIQKNEKYFSSVDAETYQALCSFLNMENGIKEVEAMQKEERSEYVSGIGRMVSGCVKRRQRIWSGLGKKSFRLSAEGRTETEIAAETGISPDEVQEILR